MPSRLVRHKTYKCELGGYYNGIENSEAAPSKNVLFLPKRQKHLKNHHADEFFGGLIQLMDLV
jgi:hypothetical protein